MSTTSSWFKHKCSGGCPPIMSRDDVKSVQIFRSEVTKSQYNVDGMYHSCIDLCIIPMV